MPQQLLRAPCWEWPVRHLGCGTVSVAEMNWASAQLMANVDKIILESGYGCSEIVPGDTMPTFTSMNEKGQPDVAGELGLMPLLTHSTQQKRRPPSYGF